MRALFSLIFRPPDVPAALSVAADRPKISRFSFNNITFHDKRVVVYLPPIFHGSGVTTCFNLASHFSQGIFRVIWVSQQVRWFIYILSVLESFFFVFFLHCQIVYFVFGFAFCVRSEIMFEFILAEISYFWKNSFLFDCKLKTLNMLNISKFQQLTSTPSLLIRTSKAYTKFKRVVYKNEGVMVNGIRYYPK